MSVGYFANGGKVGNGQWLLARDYWRAPSLQFVHLDGQTHRSIHASDSLPNLGRLTKRRRSKIGFGGEKIPTPSANWMGESQKLLLFLEEFDPLRQFSSGIF
jgi:hypothetical protein